MRNQTQTLRLMLYSGIALIVVSTLFLGRDVAATSFAAQVAVAVMMPTFFYMAGGLVYRYLAAPLAAPGIVATGAWLVAVEAIHLQSQAGQLPDLLRPYYWLIASVGAALLLTWTGRWVRIWLLIPLIPLAHLNAAWAVMEVLGLGIAWWPVLTFGVVLLWWESPRQDEEWTQVYRVSAVLLEVFLLLFSYWLPAHTAGSMVLTWVAGALLVTIIGLRHGWRSLGPVAIVMLVGAVAWGLPLAWWPPLWLLIAVGTVLLIEGLAWHDAERSALALEMSTALAMLLVGVAALLAKTLPFFDTALPPTAIVMVMAVSGALLNWIGRRRALLTAEHAGLWLLAAAWGELYFVAYGDTHAYGLWLSLLAVIALLVERVMASLHHKKPKTLQSLQGAVTRWPLADLVIGLSALVVVWAGFHAPGLAVSAPTLLFTTLAIVIGVWVAAGLLYRLPVLLHLGLWIAPLPYALLLVYLVPPFRDPAKIGLAWQALGAVLVVIGHLLRRHRPAILAPFFLVGYALLGFSLTLIVGSEMVLAAGLTLVLGVSFSTTLIVMAGGHPAWCVLAARIASPDERPYAYNHVRHAFLFLTAWLGAVWLYLMLGYATLSIPHQGLVLVLLASVWIALGRLLPRLPDVIGWPVYAAGWFLWLVGLLQVFFSPTEAIITAIVGLALSGEQLYRSRVLHWMPVFILQMLFSVLQVAWMLAMPGATFLLAVVMGLCAVGMWYDQRGEQAGRVTAVMGGVLALLLWFFRLDPVSSAGMLLLALMALALYRRWVFLLPVYAVLGALLAQFHLLASWPFLLVAGCVQVGAGTALVLALRPRRFRTLRILMFVERDWATPLLWIGALCTAAGLQAGWVAENSSLLLAGAVFAVASAYTLYTLLLRAAHFPFVAVGLFITALMLAWLRLRWLPLEQFGYAMAAFGTLLALLAVMARVVVFYTLRTLRPFAGWRGLVWWVRPLLVASLFLAGASGLMLFIADFYETSPIWIALVCLLLGVYGSLTFWQSGQLPALAVGLLAFVLAWTRFLGGLGLDGWQWYSLPLGALLLLLARVWGRSDAGPIDLVALVVLLIGGAVDYVEYGLVAGLALGAQLVFLALYGLLYRRPVPLLGALLVMAAGVAFAIVLVSPWLLPLVMGLGLLVYALLLEVQPARFTRWHAAISDWLALGTSDQTG